MNIVLTADFYDCQVKGGLIYLWDTWGKVIVVDIRELVTDLQKRSGPFIEIELNKELINKHIIYVDDVSGGVFPIDTAFMGRFLFTATESGLYKRYVEEKRLKRKEQKRKSSKLLDIRLYELASGANGVMAIAAGKEGVLELYNPKKMRISKWSHSLQKEIRDGIYLVHGKDSRSVMYEQQNILSSDKKGNLYRLSFLPSRNPRSGERMLRSYQNTKVLNDIPSILNFTQQKQQADGVKNLPAPVSTTGKIRKRLEGKFGLAFSSKKNVFVDLGNNGVKVINGPITRCRIGSGFGAFNNLLIIVLDDRVEITDFKGVM